MTPERAIALDPVSSGLHKGENDMKPNVLMASLALIILCACAVAGAGAVLGEWTDPEVIPTAAVDPAVMDGTESSSMLMGEYTTASKLVTDELEVSDGFDFPVGWPNGDGYRHGTSSDNNGYDFLELNTDGVYHPGEDWNGDGGGDSDFGHPVHAVSNGRVVAAKFYEGNLGNVTVIKHLLQDGTNVWSQYAHLNEMFVKVNDPVNRGDKIGTIGKGGNNKLSAHLHFEIRKNDSPPNAWPYDKSEEEVLKTTLGPRIFINTHRPIRRLPRHPVRRLP